MILHFSRYMWATQLGMISHIILLIKMTWHDDIDRNIGGDIITLVRRTHIITSTT